MTRRKGEIYNLRSGDVGRLLGKPGKPLARKTIASYVTAGVLKSLGQAPREGTSRTVARFCLDDVLNCKDALATEPGKEKVSAFHASKRARLDPDRVPYVKRDALLAEVESLKATVCDLERANDDLAADRDYQVENAPLRDDVFLTITAFEHRPENFDKMKAVWDACEAVGAIVPADVAKFFNGRKPKSGSENHVLADSRAGHAFNHVSKLKDGFEVDMKAFLEAFPDVECLRFETSENVAEPAEPRFPGESRFWRLVAHSEDKSKIDSQTEGFLVRADDEDAARILASEDENGGARWLDPALTLCWRLKDSGQPDRVIIAI